MPRVPLAGAVLLSLVLALPAHAQKPDLKKPGTTPLEAAKVLKPGDVLGRLRTVNSTTFVLRLEFDRLELRPGARNQQNPSHLHQNLHGRLSGAQRQLATARTPQQQITALRQLQQISAQIQRTSREQPGVGGLQASPYLVKKDYRDIEFEMAPNMDVRTNFLPFAYDDMGNPKKYTKEEIKELKGPNPNIAGYKSELSALKTGQVVRVTLARVKEKAEAADEKKDDKEKKDPDKKGPDKKEPNQVPDKVPEKAPDSKTAESKLLATRILILVESNDPVKPERGGKNK